MKMNEACLVDPCPRGTKIAQYLEMSVFLLGKKSGQFLLYHLLSSTYWLSNGGTLYESTNPWEKDIYGVVSPPNVSKKSTLKGSIAASF
jgi:hypothetical protein